MEKEGIFYSGNTFGKMKRSCPGNNFKGGGTKRNEKFGSEWMLFGMEFHENA